MARMWTNQLLDSMREITDPPADDVVAAVIKSGGLEAFNSMLKELVNNRDEIPDALPTSVQEYFENTQTLPEWAIPEKIIQGEKVFTLHGPEMIAMLFFVSLPSAYGMEKGSHVLAISAELTKRVHRRIFRTAQFITDVMQPGGLGPNVRGIRSAQKVRLIHASIRYYIKHNSKWKSEWNPEWGQPINQEDMASTLLDFSVGVLKGVEKTGIRLTSEEEDAYHHSWRVVGHIIGIRPELQAENVKAAFELAETIAERQLGKGEAGKALTRDLIRFMQGFMPRLLKGFSATAIRFLAGARVADAIESGPYNWTVIVLYFQIGILHLLDTFRRNHPGLQKYIRFLAWNLMNRVVLHEEGGDFYFEIPDELRELWRLPARNRKASRK